MATACLLIAAMAMSADSGLSGLEAPDFVLKSLGGDNLRLSEYRGEVVLINFSASWCGSCRTEMPLLDDMYERYRTAGFQLLGVNLDHDRSKAQDMVDTLGVEFPMLFDEQKNVSRLYQVEDMPLTVLIDRQGVIRFVHEEYRKGNEQDYVAELRELLSE